MPPRFNLTVLVRELMQSAELRRRFNRDPEHVMTEFGLTPDERCILYSMDPQVIKSEVYPPVDGQVGGFNIPAGEFQPDEPDCIPDPGVVLPQYPVPKPALFRVRPHRVTPAHVLEVKDAGGNVTGRFFEIVIHGQSFSRVPLPQVTITHRQTKATLTVQQPYLFGTMRCSQLRLLVTLPAVPAGLGSYDVAMTNCPGPHAKSIQNQLELVLSN
jgi:hypothetical protein